MKGRRRRKKKKRGGQGSTQQEGAPNLSLSMSFFYQIVPILLYIWCVAYVVKRNFVVYKCTTNDNNVQLFFFFMDTILCVDLLAFFFI